jgi:threonine synthase
VTSEAIPSALVCSGCGAAAEPFDPYPFRCPNADRGDDVDHVLVRLLDLSALTRTAGDEPRDEPNPFLRYRRLFRSAHIAAARGLPDPAYVDVVGALDRAVAEADGRGFVVTPFARSDVLSDHLGLGPDGGVWVKDETGDVSGSHKARHLMGLMLHLLVFERLGLTDPAARPVLAIASCGNAALAAATVAAAARWPLEVFVPTDADPVVLTRLKELDAHVTTCPRDLGVPGDPTYHRLREALRGGAIPFTVQGNLNGLAIEGGLTLGYEMAQADRDAGIDLDRVVVQVGGGALAGACSQGFAEAFALGMSDRRPRLDTVQTEGAAPLERAYRTLRGRVDADPALPLADHVAFAARHRSDFMWPWETEPRSIAHGILDDETYDWVAVTRGMLETGGTPVVVDEGTLRRANDLARDATGIDVDHTGSSGLAGLLALRAAGEIRDDERIAVLFTGVRRAAPDDRGGI